MIESINNEKIKFYKKLREKKHIIENKKYIVEGSHLVIEAYKKGLLLEIIHTNSYNVTINVPSTLVSEKVISSISLLKSTPNVMGVVKLEEKTEIKGKKIILLDNVQDPGNVGTIIRSALAFNVDTVILSEDSVSIYNDKMIRSSEGTIFNMNVIRMNLKEAIEKIKENGIKIYYADMKGNINLDEANIKDYALVLGSEGQGISNYIKELSDDSIKIPINNLCESLNVSICGGIIMYKFRWIVWIM